MTSFAVQQGPTPDEELHAVSIPRDHHQQYQPIAKGLGIYTTNYVPEGYVPASYPEEPHYIHNPPTPHSNTDDGMRARRERSITRGRADSPFASSSNKSRISHSPMPRSKKEKKSKLDRSKTPKLTAPLSILTKDMEVPLRDMGAWVNRSTEARLQEVEKRNGYVTRPMNSFMLYRSAFAERTKQWCLQNNHQVVSSVSGESWPMEPAEVRDRYNNWAKTERANHQAAHPQYKFSPSKANGKRGRRDEYSDDEDEAEAIDVGDPDGDYRGPRSKRRPRDARESSCLHHNDPFASTYHPYYGNQFGVYPSPEYQQAQPAGRSLPSNIAYDPYGQAFDPNTHNYYVQQPQFTFNRDQQTVRVPTPTSLASTGATSLGGFGMPGSSNTDDLFASPRRQTPLQSFDSYSRQMYLAQQRHNAEKQAQVYHHPQFHTATHQSQESQQYLHTQLQTSHALDPSLAAAFTEFSASGDQKSHFENALGEHFVPSEYYDQHISPNATLAPHWSPTDELKKNDF